jgi:hypothetical protein
MAKKEVINVTPRAAAEFKKLFGPPPLLNPEDSKIYDAILNGLAEDEKPRSFIARILLRDVADLVYQRLWLAGLATRLISQAHKQRIRGWADHYTNDAYSRKLRLRAGSSKLELKPGIPADGAGSEAEKALEAEIDKIDVETAEKLTNLVKAAKGPVDGANVFLDWISHYERVQSLLAAVDKRFRDTLNLLDDYRQGLGQRVRQVADEIVDVEFEECPLPAREQQVAVPPSSITTAEAAVPSPQAMLPSSVAEPVGSLVETSASLRPVRSTQRRRLHPGGAQRRRPSAPSRPGRAQPNPTSSDEAEAGKVAGSVETGPAGELRSSATEL